MPDNPDKCEQVAVGYLLTDEEVDVVSDRALYPHYQLEFARFAPEAQFLMFEKMANDRGGGAHACDFDG